MTSKPINPRAFALPLIGQAVASRVGNRVACVAELDARIQIVLLPGDGGPPRQLTADVAPPAARSWSGPDIDWSPDGRTLAFVGLDRGRSNVWTVHAETGDVRRTTNHNWTDRSPRWSPDGLSIAMVTEIDGVDTVGVAAAGGGWPRRLTALDTHASEPAWSPDGRALAVTATPVGDRSHNRDIRAVDVATGAERRLTATDGNADTSPAWSPDGDRIAFVSERSGWKQVWTMAADGSDQRLVSPEEAEQTAPAWSPDGARLGWLSRRGIDADVVAFDIPAGDRVVLPVNGGAPSSISWFADGDALCVVASSPVAAHDVWRLPLTGSPTALTAMTPVALACVPLIEPAVVRYRSADGLEIEALLYTPSGVQDGEGRPGLVYVHGGPTWQVDRGWLPEVQHLASAGYTVIAPNFRGSTGYGRAFDRANDGDWGGGDLDDCVAAAEELRRLPWIDADRIGVWGGSYGGYLTLLAVGKRPRAFQAGVDLYGSSDEATLWMQSDTPGRRGIEEEVGTPLTDRARFRLGAPLRYADQIVAPLLMLHGEEDRRVTLAQSEAMRAAMERLGKVFEYHRYPGEPHGFRKIDNWVDVQEKIADFLGRHL